MAMCISRCSIRAIGCSFNSSKQNPQTLRGYRKEFEVKALGNGLLVGFIIVMSILWGLAMTLNFCIVDKKLTKLEKKR